MARPDHISVTQIRMIEKCGMQWYWRYAEGLRVPPGIALIIGSSTHAAIEKDLSWKIKTGALLEEGAVKEIASEAVDERWLEGPALTPEEQEEGTEKVLGRTRDTAVSLAALHHRYVAPTLTPQYVERGFRLHLPNGLPSLLGYVDIQELVPAQNDDKAACIRVRDSKTASKKPPKGSADTSLQLTGYALGVKVLEGAAPRSLHLDTLVSKSVPAVDLQETTRGNADFRAFLDRVALVAKVIKNEVFLPAPQDSWVCSERWCGYYDEICPFGRRGRSNRPKS